MNSLKLLYSHNLEVSVRSAEEPHGRAWSPPEAAVSRGPGGAVRSLRGRSRGTGTRGAPERCSERGRASLLVLLFLGQPCSAQRAGPRQRLGAAGRSPHLREDATVSRAGSARRRRPGSEPGPSRRLTPSTSPPRRAAPIADILSAPRPLWRRLRPGNRRPPALAASSLLPSLLPSVRVRAAATAAGTGTRHGTGLTGSGEGRLKRAEGPLYC